MDIERLKQQAAEVLQGQRKEDVREAVQQAVSQVTTRERDIRAAVGKLEAAQAAQAEALGEVDLAQNALERAAVALAAEIEKAG